MKQGKLVGAYKVVSKLYEQRIPLPISYKLYKLRNALQKAWDFQADSEEKLIDEFKPVSAQNGLLKFSDPETAKQFNERVKEVLDMDSDIEITPIEIPMLDELSIAPGEIEALEGIVTFVE